MDSAKTLTCFAVVTSPSQRIASKLYTGTTELSGAECWGWEEWQRGFSLLWPGPSFSYCPWVYTPYRHHGQWFLWKWHRFRAMLQLCFLFIIVSATLKCLWNLGYRRTPVIGFAPYNEMSQLTLWSEPYKRGLIRLSIGIRKCICRSTEKMLHCNPIFGLWVKVSEDVNMALTYGSPD